MQLMPQPPLQPGEDLVYTTRTSWWSERYLLALGVALLPLAGLGGVLIARAWWSVESSRVWVTTRRVVWQQGLLDRRIVEVNLKRIDAVVVEQRLDERLMGCGTVEVGAGTLGRIRVEAVAAPTLLRDFIVELQSRAG